MLMATQSRAERKVTRKHRVRIGMNSGGISTLVVDAVIGVVVVVVVVVPSTIRSILGRQRC